MITVKNDGKEKAQSCTAEFETFATDTYWGHFHCTVSGYGSDEFSAKENAKEQIRNLIAELNKELEQ